MANADGSIIIDTVVDKKGLTTGLSTVEKGTKNLIGTFGKLAATIGITFGVSALSNFTKESKELYKVQLENEKKLETILRQRFNASNATIQSIYELTAAEQALGVIGDEVQIAGAQQLATFLKQEESLKTLIPAMNNLVAQQAGYDATTGDAVNIANMFGKVLDGQVGSLKRVGISFSEAEEQILKYGNESERAAILAQVITNNVGEMNKALAQTDIGRQIQLANTFGDIKEQFGAAFTQLAILLLPALKLVATVLSVVANAARAAATNIAALFGKKVQTDATNQANSIGSLGSSTEEAANAMDSLGTATKKTAKEAKKSLATFDEINTLTSNMSDSTDGATAGISDVDIGGFGDVSTLFEPMEYANKINTALTFIMGVIGLALCAVGLILLFTGNIAWGIGFIIAGASMFSVSAFALGSFSTGEIQNALSALMGIAGGALLGIGIILLFLGSVVWGIGFIIAGAAIVGAQAAKIIKFDENKIVSTLTLIQGIAAGALLALGIMLLFFSGANPLSIGLIATGALLLNITTAQIIAGQVEKDVADMIYKITALASGAMLVLGIILLLFAVSLPLALGLIVAGAIGLATTVALNWDFVKNKATEIFSDILNWVKTWGLLVLGILLLFSGVGVPIGMGLIFAASQNLAEAKDPLWTYMLDKIKEVWSQVKNYWNSNIAKYFTAEWWGNLAKNAINGFIRWFMNGLNKLIDEINDFSFDLPEILGGGRIGFNIPKREIPQLAKGGIVSRSTIAEIGEAGKEAVLPLENNTGWMDELADKLASRGAMSGETVREEHYYLSETELMRVVYKLFKGGEQLQGGSFVNA